MNARYYKLGVLFIALLFAVVFSGFGSCHMDNVKYTGGGTIPSAQKSCIDGETANFGFVLDNCGDEIKGGITYHDQAFDIEDWLYRCNDGAGVGNKEAQALAQGVKFTAEWTGAANFLDGVGSAEFNYESQNPFCRGDGEGLAWVVDLGEGAGSHGVLCIKITSGVFNHYFNCYAEVSGNIQQHECPPAGPPIPD